MNSSKWPPGRACAVIFVGSAFFGFPVLLLSPKLPGGWLLLAISGFGWAAIAALAVTKICASVSPPTATRFLIAVVAIVVVGFAVMYPRLNSNLPGVGSDRDEDADIAVRAAFDGRYPFTPKTYLGNTITHMPGGLLIASPFVAVGSSALQNIAAFAVGAIVLERLLGARRALYAATLIATCSWFWFEVFNGGDTPATMIYVTAGAALLWSRENRRERIVAAAILGVALCTRANIWSCGVPIVAAVWGRHGLRAAAESAASAVFTLVVLTVPFLVPDPGRYTPLGSGAAKFFDPVADAFPHAATVVPALAIMVAAVAGAYVAWWRRDAAGLFAGLAVTQFLQSGLLLLLTPFLHSGFWAHNWAFYMALGVIPASVSLALIFETSSLDIERGVGVAGSVHG